MSAGPHRHVLPLNLTRLTRDPVQVCLVPLLHRNRDDLGHVIGMQLDDALLQPLELLLPRLEQHQHFVFVLQLPLPAIDRPQCRQDVRARRQPVAHHFLRHLRRRVRVGQRSEDEHGIGHPVLLVSVPTGHAQAPMGRLMEKTQPFPGRSRTSRVPPLAWTPWRLMASPTPRPERSALRRSNGRKSCSVRPAGSPPHSSSTSMRILPSAATVRRETWPLLRLNLKALLRRLETADVRSSRSASTATVQGTAATVRWTPLAVASRAAVSSMSRMNSDRTMRARCCAPVLSRTAAKERSVISRRPINARPSTAPVLPLIRTCPLRKTWYATIAAERRLRCSWARAANRCISPTDSDCSRSRRNSVTAAPMASSRQRLRLRNSSDAIGEPSSTARSVRHSHTSP